MTRRLSLVLAALGMLSVLTPAMSSASAAGIPVQGWSEPEAVMAGVTTPQTGALYTISTLLEGKAIRWNPCTPIHWQFRANGAPAGGLTVVKQTIARVAQATRTTWVFDGTVSTAPATTWLPRSTSGIRPVLIGWADAASSDLLRNQPRGVLGVTRTAWFGVQKDGTTVASIRAAVIVLDRTDKLPLTGPVSWRTVMLHELTHAMGLNHAGSNRQLMYPVLQRNLTDLQSGDLQGLAKVGRAAGCITIPS